MILTLADKMLITYAVAQSFLLGLVIGFIAGRYGCGNGYKIHKETVREWTRRMMDDSDRHP